MTAATTQDTAGSEPLTHLDEHAWHDNITWYAEGPRGALHLIRWSSKSGNVTAWRGLRGPAVHRGTAQTIEDARREAARMAELIAAGTKN